MIYEELYSFDDYYRRKYGIICGVDEAGRGPLAGPVAVAAVILSPDIRYDRLTDSKKVSDKARRVLYQEIKATALSYHIELIDNKTIDELNILGATMLGMKKCIESLMTAEPKIALVDGNKTPSVELKTEAVIKGDAKSASIAAASILAKVTRDDYMMELAYKYPEYRFEKHKGYPTKEHYEAIKEYGVTPYHRVSFLKTLEKH